MAGYTQTPLVKKLGIKQGATLYVYEAPVGYLDWLYPLPEGVTFVNKLVRSMDFIHLFVSEQKILKKEFTKAKKHLAKDGMIWVSWPKKSAKRQTDLDDNVIRNFGLKEGLVDVKVCAVDDVWSGLKFVVRLKDR